MDEFDLAQRLVEVAAAGSWLGPPEWTAPSVQCEHGAIRREEARGAVVAVLQELATSHEAKDSHDGMSPFEMRLLADSIKKEECYGRVC